MGLQAPKDCRCYKQLVPTALKQTANAECLDQMVRPESLQMSKLQNHEAFMAGLTIYKARPDKGYSVTDCISMHAMRERGVSDILTHDEHFRQEGFTVLL